MAKREDIEYAVSITRVVQAPRQTLETFGTTTIRYYLVSELMDAVGKVRIREGKVYSERPQIITPNAYASALLEGFGEHAQAYAEWLREHGELLKIMRYGLQFRKNELHTETVSEVLDDVCGRVRQQVETANEPLTAVIVGADELWEVSLLKFLVDFIGRSAPRNLRDLQAREQEEGRGERREIELAFRQAAEDPARIAALGELLQRRGLFEAYEDRFYALVRRPK